MAPQINIGTSGWNYIHWKDNFYHSNCPKSKWLEFYARNFMTVELNTTFYGLPKPKTFENWRLRTPEKFLWAVKANRYITHIKKLKAADDALARFFNAAGLLKEKLGPILFQIPPNLVFDDDLLDGFCQCLKTYEYLYALEVRHPSWIEDRVINRLKNYNIAFCISDTAGRYPYREVITADFTYIRLHGSKELYASDYTEEELQTWAQKIRGWNTNTFLYFDNDYNGYAPKNVMRLKEILGPT